MIDGYWLLNFFSRRDEAGAVHDENDKRPDDEGEGEEIDVDPSGCEEQIAC